MTSVPQDVDTQPDSATLDALANLVRGERLGGLRRQLEDPGRLHLLRAVRRPRHHIRPDLGPRTTEPSRCARLLPSAALLPSDPQSYLRRRPTWTPILPSARKREPTKAGLVNATLAS
ncbi:MAG: hypothetical protein M3N47_07465 [Chloroflexota bacterium]|nr:hypothetical protein [Chloroflexota bacterium]